MREHSDGEEAEKPGRDEDIDTNIGLEKEVGHDDNTDNVSKAAELCYLHDLPCLLCHDAEDDGAESPDNDDHGACEPGDLVTVADTDMIIIISQAGEGQSE